MHKQYLPLLGLALFVLSAMAIAQEEFSADLYNSKSGKEMVSQAKIYMAKDKMRIESHEQTPGGQGVMIMNFQTRVMDMFMPGRKMYIEAPQGQGPMQRNFNFFRTGDVENACSDWQKMKPESTGTCKKDGDEVVNGRKTVKYEGTSSSGKTGYFWIDSALRFPVKWQDQDNSGELRNIQVGAQPASLFEVPAGYQKMEMPIGMNPNMQRP